MKYDDRYIVELSRAAIFDETPFVPAESVDWEYIYNKSIEQNITGLLFTAISKLPNEYKPDKDLYAKWQQKMLETIAVTSRQYNEFLKMSKVVSNAGIKMVGLKGCIIRNLYPVPELRTMGDFDILVRKADLNETTKLFKNEKYEIKKDIFGITAKKDIYYWEVFTSLGEEFAADANKYTDIIYNSSFKYETIYSVGITWFLSHVIIHTGRHYVEEGAGLRNLCDIALILDKHKGNIDFEQLYQTCKEQNYEKIYRYIISAVEEFYKVDLSQLSVQRLKADSFMEYTLFSGVFGKNDNILLHQLTKATDDEITGKRKLFFPSVKTLDYRYTYLKKFPFLLPIAWIQRFFSGVFRQKYSPITMIKQMKDAEDYSNIRTKWMNELGLKHKH